MMTVGTKVPEAKGFLIPNRLFTAGDSMYCPPIKAETVKANKAKMEYCTDMEQ